MRNIKLVKKLMKLNAEGSVGLGLPKQLVKTLDWSSDDFVNINVAGDTLHITKIKMK